MSILYNRCSTKDANIKKSNIVLNNKGITLINLIITIIVMILLASFSYMAYTSLVGNAQFSKYVHEISEVEQVVSNLRSYNKQTLRATAEEDLNKGFKKVYLNNVPDEFDSFDKDETTGYVIDLENINKKELVFGHQRLNGITATFGKDDVFVYDKSGRVYYVKGFTNSEGKYFHRSDAEAKFPIREEPVIESVSYQLQSEDSYALVSIAAKPYYGGNLIVKFEGKTLQNAGEDTYTTMVNQNKAYSVLVKEENGYYNSVTKNISGIRISEDNTAPIVDKMEVVYTRLDACIEVEVHDYESKIVGYSFSTSSSEPNEWTQCSSNYFSKVFDAPTSDTYYFHAINEFGKYVCESARVNIVVEYEITFNNNGGTGGPGTQMKQHGEDLTISSTVPTRSTYTFRGWSESNKNGSSVDYVPGGIYEKEGDNTLYAVWERNGYTVVYDSNGGTALDESIATKEHGTDLIITDKVPTRVGYTFLGWAENNEAVVPEYYKGSSYVRNEDTTMFAVWSEVTYEVSYNAKGGEGEPSSQTKYSTRELTLSTKIPVKDGFDFGGWSLSSGENSPVQYQPGGKFNKNEDATLYAVWNINTFTITYYGNGGVGTPAVETKEFGTPYTISEATLTKQGHIFKGWSTSSNATTVEYTKGQKYNENANLVLYAVWQKETYTVSFDANGGSGAPVNQEKVYNEALTLSSVVPTYPGHIFKGWGQSENSTLVQYNPGGMYTTNGNITLYAIWVERVAVLLDGKTVNANLKKLAGMSNPSISSANDTITAIEWTTRLENEDRAIYISTSSSNSLVYAWFDNGVIYLYSEAPVVMFNNDSSHLFDNMRSLKSVDFSRLDSSEVLDMSGMFQECRSLDKIELLSLDTSKVKYMNNMFYNCLGLTELDLSSFDTTSVVNMREFFKNCINLTTIKVSEMFVVENVNDSNNMFLDCSKLRGEHNTVYSPEHIDKEYAHFDGGTSNPGYFYKVISANVKYTISFNKNTTDSNVTGMPTSQIKRQGVDMELTFDIPLRSDYVFVGWSTTPGENNPVEYLPGGTFELNSDTVLYAVWFKSAQYVSGETFCGIIKRLAGHSGGTYSTEDKFVRRFIWQTTKPSEDILSHASNVGVSSGSPIYAWFVPDTSAANSTGVIMLWSEAEGIRFNDKVNQMFRRFRALEKLDPIRDLGITGPTDNITDMNNFFCGCNALTTLDVTGFNTVNVSNMQDMFSYCHSLRSINVSTLNTSKVTKMNNMFRECKALVSLNLTSFDTTSVKEMPAMFRDCNALTSLNLSSFDTISLTSASQMFYNCPNLDRIYVSNLFVMDKVSVNNSSQMFYGCTKLKGDYGTIFVPGKDNKTYAHFDGGEEDPGYFSRYN